MAVLLVVALVLTALVARARGRFWPLPAAVFTAGALLLYPVAVARYDAVVVATLAAAVALATLASHERGRLRTLALVAAWASLGFGAAAKLVPALAAAPLALLRGRRSLVPGAAAFAGVVALFFVPAYLVGGAGFLESFSYHTKRGLQIESLPASVLMRLGYVRDIVFGFGSFEVTGYGSRFWTSMSLPVTGALLLLTGAVALRERLLGRFGSPEVPRFAAAFLLAFLVGSKVLSPQYVLWLLPLIPLAARGAWGVAVSAVFLATCWATSQVFPAHYGDLYRGEATAINTLLGRNVLLVVLWGLMLALPHDAGKPSGKGPT
jgi:uncharacterized membrane protein